MRSLPPSRLGFWSVLALVTGSQIGTSIFMAPAHLAPFGLSGLWGWALSGAGALSLAFVFAQLCTAFPQTGGPHVYVHALLGHRAAFFVGWTYWIVSWVSSTAVISTMAGCLVPFIGPLSADVLLMIQLIILCAFLGFNLKGIIYAGKTEMVLTCCKVFMFVFFPLGCLFLFDIDHFVQPESRVWSHSTQTLGHLTVVTLWGFIGLEAATAPAGSVDNPQKTIPRAVLGGTFLVAFLYLANSVCIMGALPGETLRVSPAPYADVARAMLGQYGYLFVSAMGAVVCMGTLNAWILVSGQVALGLSESGFFPEFFQKRNRHGAPFWSLILSSVGLVPLLIVTARPNIAEQILIIVDFSVTALVFVYMCCAMAYLILWWRMRPNLGGWVGLIALCFCIWVMVCLPWTTLMWASVVPISGIPVFLWMRNKQ